MPKPSMPIPLARLLSLTVLILLDVTVNLAAVTGAPSVRAVASPEPGWPQWRGPERNGISLETGLLHSWPVNGPRLLWTSRNLGRGYSAPIIVGDRIYLTGDVGDRLRIFALDLQGETVWQSENGRSWKTPYPGARATCTFSAGRLYHLNAHGRLACLDASTGAELWSFNILERFGGKNITWALSECVLVDGPHIFVTPGGTGGLMVALDKQTGETVWSSEALHLGPSPYPDHQRVSEPNGQTDSAGYTSPILLTTARSRLLVSCSLRHAFAVDADSGQLLWTRPLKTRHGVIAATPVLCDDAVFVTAPDTERGGLLLGLAHTGDSRIQERWTTPLDTCHGGLVRVGDRLIGSWYRKGKGWACVDLPTGSIRYSLEDLAKGSVLYADQRLYVLSEEGEAALLRSSEDGFSYAGRFQLVEERVRDAWTHPVILDGRLYLRYHDALHCYDVKAP